MIKAIRLLSKLTITFSAVLVLAVFALGANNTYAAEIEGDGSGTSGSSSTGSASSGGGGTEVGEIYQYLYDTVDIISVLIGVVLIGSTIFAGIQYTTSGGESAKVQKAKGRLASNVTVLVLYIFSASILNFILPG